MYHSGRSTTTNDESTIPRKATITTLELQSSGSPGTLALLAPRRGNGRMPGGEGLWVLS